jgi:phospholipid/cholesterol/gamma-HCH transport system permease protein
MSNDTQPATLEFIATTNTIHCSGDWTLAGIKQLQRQLELPRWPNATITIDGSAIRTMDTAGAWLLFRTYQGSKQSGQSFVLQGFKKANTDLLELITHYATAQQPTLPSPSIGFLEKIGRETYDRFIQLINFLAFIGETFLVLVRSLLSPSQIRWAALFANLHSAGLAALPIIGLMAFLMGVVLAYQGGTQLSTYGANIFIVDLVGITLLRELAPLLTAILVAGRSGSAYTAQIGTMQVTQEIDALQTLGISPMELLVIPKLLALIILMPLLSAFADVLGVIGGMLIAKVSLGVNVTDFLERFPQAVSLTHYLIGIGKAPVFAAVIAIVGCYQGFQVKGGAEVVGKRVTTSVVQAIFLVIVVDAVFSILFNLLGI